MAINIEVWVKIIFNYLFDQKFWAFWLLCGGGSSAASAPLFCQLPLSFYLSRLLSHTVTVSPDQATKDSYILKLVFVFLQDFPEKIVF